jgi:hypothetical protein
MHSAGILAMGVLMDRIFARLPPKSDIETVECELRKVALTCRWTEGTWQSIGVKCRLYWSRHISEMQATDEIFVLRYTGLRGPAL